MLFIFALATASAQEKTPYDHQFSLTHSPLHLVLPMLEVTGEFRLSDRVGFGGVVGVGAPLGVPAGSVGPTFRYYPVGDFDHGMQLGAEAILAVAADGADVGTAISAGPFIGYKIAARFGLTFEGEVGAAVLSASGTDAATTVTATPILNLNLGWSF